MQRNKFETKKMKKQHEIEDDLRLEIIRTLFQPQTQSHKH